MDLCDTEETAPSKGLNVHTEKVVSQPDGNTINLQVIRPDTDETLACVYYIHGGGMASRRVTTGCTGVGASSLLRMAWPSSWWTSETRSCLLQYRRFHRSPPGSTTACPD